MSTERTVTLVGILCGSMLTVAMPLPAVATTLSVQELQLTKNGAFNTTPVGARDSISPWVVYATTNFTVGSQSSIWYQRFDANAVVGTAVQVSTGTTSDQLDDTDGNSIVYTAYQSTTSLAGSINLYDPVTQTVATVGTAPSLYGARVSGDNVVWLEGTSGATSVMLANTTTPTAAPINLAGPSPSVSSVDVGSRFVVYERVVNGQHDVMAYDLAQKVTVAVANNPNLNERLPHTSGSWVVWEVQATGSTAVIAMNMDTQQVVTVAQGAMTNESPTIDGNLIAYQANPNGVFNVYVYRIPQGDTFQVTSNSNDEQLNDVFGNMVTYVDNRGGSYNVYVSMLTFATPADPNGTTTGGGGSTNPNTVTSDPNAVGSDPNTGTNPNTVSSDPNGSSNPNTPVTNPNTSNPNTPGSTDPNGGYSGGCGHSWCGERGREPFLNVHWHRGETHVDVGMCRPVWFVVPATLPARDWGWDGDVRTAYVMVQDVKNGFVLCTYQQTRASSDQPYAFVSCTNGAKAGQGMWVNYVDLHWAMGSGDHDDGSHDAWLGLDLRNHHSDH